MHRTPLMLRLGLRRFAPFLAALALSGALQASAATPEAGERIAMLLKAFDQAALLKDDGSSSILRRWAEPIRPRMLNTFGHDWHEHALRELREQAALVDIAVAPAQAGVEENMVFEFVERPFLMSGGSSAGCLAHSRWTTATGRFLRVNLTINRSWRDLEDLKRCIRHEILHGLGLLGHPHFADSILSYSSGRRELTDVDRTLLKVLYDPRLKGGFYRLPALLEARPVIVEAVLGAGGKGVDAAGFGGAYIESVVRSMTAEAEAGGTAAQIQLGNAYAHGHHVQVSRENALHYWRMAAERGEPEAQYQLAMALFEKPQATGARAEAETWTRRAAEKGHANAQYELGRAMRDGRAGTSDAVQALTWLLIAGEQGHSRAVRAADALAASLSAEKAAEARARAKEFKPAR